jgi:Zn ribbon nucleic-acid-binding protein
MSDNTLARKRGIAMTGPDCPQCHAPGAVRVGTMYRQTPVLITARGDWRYDESFDATDTYYCVACGHEWDERRTGRARATTASAAKSLAYGGR